MHFRSATSLVAVLLLAAGCISDTAAPSNNSPAASVSSTDATTRDIDTGIVRGVVIDDAQLPIENATLRLDSRSASSDAAGRFTFDDVPIGTYTLTASAGGFLNGSLEVKVESDAATEVRLRLQTAATSVPYHESQTQSGIHACGVGWRTGPNPPSYTGVCIALQHAGASVVDKSMLSFHVKISNASGFWHESTWSPSSPLRGGMNVIWGYVLDDGLSLEAVARNGSRESPLRFTSSIEDWLAAIAETPSVFCNPAECELRSFHASYGETLGASSPADAGVVVNQRYDVWLTTFYNGPVPADFTALPPG